MKIRRPLVGQTIVFCGLPRLRSSRFHNSTGDPIMATERQMEANKLNAQKSTGPKTPEGKAKSSCQPPVLRLRLQHHHHPGRRSRRIPRSRRRLHRRTPAHLRDRTSPRGEDGSTALVIPSRPPPPGRSFHLPGLRRHRICRPQGPRPPHSLPDFRRPRLPPRSQRACKGKETKIKL